MAAKNFFTENAKLLIVLGTIALVSAGALYDLYLEKPPVVLDNEVTALDTQQWPPAPDFNFTDIDGHPHNLSDFKGKTVLIDFWATWCPTCLVEFPNIVSFVAEQKGDIILVALSSDQGLAPIHDFIAKQKISIQNALKLPYMFVALDQNRHITRDVFLTELYPETIFIAPDQHMVRKSIGVTEWNQPELTQFFKVLKNRENTLSTPQRE